MQTPFNSSRLQRPSLADFRPQTAPLFHTHPIEEERDQEAGAQEDDDSDDQSTPRASLAGLTIQRRLSRDDTATDSHHPLFASSQFFDSNKSSHRSLAASSKQSHENLRSQRVLARNSFAWPSSSTSAEPSSHPSKSASLGRRWSRTKESFTHMRESVVKPLMRRSSVAMETSAASSSPAPAPRTIPTSTVLPPLSPSKRGAKNADDRPKKLQARGILNDRKDTPAPPSYGLARPMAGPQALPFQLQVQGGEGARKAAAQFNTPVPLFAAQRDPSPSTSRNASRVRMSSNPSAYDSGADLSSCSDSHHEDLDLDMDGDVNMEQDVEQESIPYARDFVQVLPSEISLQIFEYLDAHDLLVAQHMGPAWKVLANELSVWRAAYMRKYGRELLEANGKPIPPPIQVGGAGLGRTNKPIQPWNKMYRARVELEKNWRKGADQAGKAVYLSGHTDSVYCVQFDEEKIITGSRDRTIRVWDINTFQCIRVIGGPNVRPTLGPKTLRTVDYPAFHLATASVNGTAYGDSIYRVPSQWHDASILCLQYDTEILVTGSSDSDLLVWDIHTYEPIRRLKKHTGGVLDVALDSKYIVSCSKDSRIIVWDRETYEPIGELTGHRGPVNAVQLRGHQLVSASGDGIARLWDLNTMKLVKEFSAKERGLAAVEFSEDMQYVLAGGNDHITYKFNVETGKEVQQFTGHSQLVRSLWLDSANSRVVSGSYDLDLRVYDFNTGEEIWRAEEWTTSWMLAAKSDYRRIVATSQDGRILLVDFGLIKGGRNDGEKIQDVDLLRGIEATSAVLWRNPWTREII